MSTFSERLRELRKEFPITQDELLKVINQKNSRNISKSMLSKWENGKEEPQKFQDVVALAEFFGVKADYLSCLTDDKYGEDIKYKEIPILGTIAAGIPMQCQEDIIGSEYILPNEHVDFCLKVKGSSMIGARIYNGDIVYIRVQPDVENGEIAAIQIDGQEATLKRFYKIDGAVMLKSENPDFKDMVFSKKDMKEVRILGKAIFIKGEVR